MKNALCAAILLVAVAASVPAEVGFGITAGFPPFLAMQMEDSGSPGIVPLPLFWGAALRYRPSLLLIDAGVSTWESGLLLYAYLNFGLSLDLWVFLFGFSGGVDVINLSVPLTGISDFTNYYAVGFDGKLSLEVKAGDFSLGLSLAVPVDMVANILLHNGEASGTHDILRMFTAQASLTVTYWLGSSRRR